MMDLDRLTPGDRAEIETFAAYLRDTAGVPAREEDRTREQRTRERVAYRKHYPDDAPERVLGAVEVYPPDGEPS